jgi:hypothetical protein
MDRLQIQLVIRLDRYKVHVLTLDGFCDGLRIDEVVLVGLHEGLHKLRFDQPDLVSLLPQCSAKEVRPGTGFQADQ